MSETYAMALTLDAVERALDRKPLRDPALREEWNADAGVAARDLQELARRLRLASVRTFRLTPEDSQRLQAALYEAEIILEEAEVRYA